MIDPFVVLIIAKASRQRQYESAGRDGRDKELPHLRRAKAHVCFISRDGGTDSVESHGVGHARNGAFLHLFVLSDAVHDEKAFLGADMCTASSDGMRRPLTPFLV